MMGRGYPKPIKVTGRPLELTGVTDVLAVHPTVTDAIAALNA